MKMNSTKTTKEIEELEKSLSELDQHYRIVDCSFIQDSYMKQRNILVNKILALKKLSVS